MKKLPRRSTKAKHTNVSVQTTGKWVERISQSERALRKEYVILSRLLRSSGIRLRNQSDHEGLGESLTGSRQD